MAGGQEVERGGRARVEVGRDREGVVMIAAGELQG